MTPNQVLIVAAIGGLAATVGLVLAVAAALALYTLITRLVDAAADRRERRRARAADDLSTCRAIDALPLTTHPKE